LRVFSGYFTGAFYDAVRQQNLPGSSWDDSVSLENVSFENLRFAGKYGRMDIGGATQHSTFTNVTINNCSAITDEVSTDWIYDANRVDDGGANTQNGAFRLAFGKATLNGLTFTNNYVDFHYQGMYISKTGGNTMANITASNNRISNTKHNAIGIHNFTGNLTINNNIVKNCLDAVSPEETDPDVWTEGGERALRFSKGTNATVVISGNRISNAYKQVIYYGGSTDILSGTYSITDNYYNGLKLADATGTDVSFNITHD